MTEPSDSHIPSLLSGLLPVAALLILLPALDLTLRTLAMAAITIGAAATADALRHRQSLSGSLLRFLATLAAAACLGATQYLSGALTGCFAGPIHALLAAMIAIAVLDAIQPSPWLDALLVLLTLPILALHSTAGWLDLIPWIAAILFALGARFRQNRNAMRPVLAVVFFLPMLFSPLFITINSLSDRETVLLQTDDFAVFTDPLAGTGGCPLLQNLKGIKELNPFPGAEWTVLPAETASRTISGRQTLFSPGLAGSMVPAETSSPLVRPHFLPDLLRFYPGRGILPWTERDRLEIKITRGLLGIWRIKKVTVHGYRFHLLQDKVAGNGQVHTLTGASEGLALLEIGLETGSIQLLTATLEGQLRQITPLRFDPIGVRWCDGPLVYGSETDHLSGLLTYLVAFFDPSGSFTHGLQASGPIHEILPLTENELVMFHGPYIQRLGRNGENLTLVERTSDGPVIATATTDGRIFFIDFLEGRLCSWNGQDTTIVDLGNSAGSLLTASGSGTWQCDFGETVMNRLEAGDTHEIEMPVHWLAATGLNLWIGLRDGRALQLKPDGTQSDPIIWPGTIPPQQVGEQLLTRNENELLLLDMEGTILKRFSGVTIENKEGMRNTEY